MTELHDFHSDATQVHSMSNSWSKYCTLVYISSMKLFLNFGATTADSRSISLKEILSKLFRQCLGKLFLDNYFSKFIYLEIIFKLFLYSV